MLATQEDGGPSTIRYEAANLHRFPGMQPYGNYPVHVIVKHRRVLLLGLVDSEFDKRTTAIRAGEVPQHGGVEDAVSVRRAGTR